MKFQPRKPPRYQQDYSIYFLTFCTFKRLPLLHSSGIPEFLIEELRFYEQKIQKLVAYTIMPEHVHVMVEVIEGKSLSKFLHSYKSFTSKEIKKRIANDCSRRLPAVVPDVLYSPTGRRLLHLEHIWQPGTMDHCIRTLWDINDFGKHLSYIFFNSYKHLGIAPKNFPYHNFMEFVRQGIFDEQFCAMDEETVKGCEKYE